MEKKMELNLEEMENVTGGMIVNDNGTYYLCDSATGRIIEKYNNLASAEDGAYWNKQSSTLITGEDYKKRFGWDVKENKYIANGEDYHG